MLVRIAMIAITTRSSINVNFIHLRLIMNLLSVMFSDFCFHLANFILSAGDTAAAAFGEYCIELINTLFQVFSISLLTIKKFNSLLRHGQS